MWDLRGSSTRQANQGQADEPNGKDRRHDERHPCVLGRIAVRTLHPHAAVIIPRDREVQELETPVLACGSAMGSNKRFIEGLSSRIRRAYWMSPDERCRALGG